MARSIEDIQCDTKRSRNRFTRTLDELIVQTNPKNVADDAKIHVLDALNEPKVQTALDVVVVLIVGGTAMGVRRNCNHSKEADHIREMIETAAKQFFEIQHTHPGWLSGGVCLCVFDPCLSRCGAQAWGAGWRLRSLCNTKTGRVFPLSQPVLCAIGDLSSEPAD